jgi:hypothetical protein
MCEDADPEWDAIADKHLYLENQLSDKVEAVVANKTDCDRLAQQASDTKDTEAPPWDKECQHSFDTLQKALCNAPVLALPDAKAKYCLQIDTSQYALGAVLTQMHDKEQNVLG